MATATKTKRASSKANTGGAGSHEEDVSAAAAKHDTTARAGERVREDVQAPRRRKRSTLWIEGPDDHEERKGQSLETHSHEVIRAWAEHRQAEPATIAGTEHGDHLGVLRFDFPGYSSSRKIEHVSWDDWFGTFDSRHLSFIYQEHKRDGSESNFFRLNNPDREDA